MQNVANPFNRLVPKAVENSDFARNLRSAKTVLASANTSQTVFKTFSFS